ncbi:MAG: class I SAM-dependent methyltransferase, partial [Archaeoglobi archaeon]|nr:class I SAM-dependent methyltransferase [Candidatus Mnemosynella sp.]
MGESRENELEILKELLESNKRLLEVLKNFSREEKREERISVPVSPKRIRESMMKAKKICLPTLIQMGVVTNIFTAINEGLRTVESISSNYGYRNKKLLKSYLFTMERYGILARENEEFYIKNGIKIELDKKDLNSDKVTDDLISFISALLRAFPYALLDEKHPMASVDFNKDADLWNIWLENDWFRMTREIISSISQIGPGDYVLDLGCGSASLPYYAEIVGPRGRAVGLDISKNMVEICKNKIEERGFYWAKVRKENIESILLFKDKYDIMILSFVLPFINNPMRVFKNANKGLRNGGKLVILTKLFSNEPLYDFLDSMIPG